MVRGINSPEILLRQCRHLLEGIETKDGGILKEIESIKTEVNAMILACQNGNEKLAKAALELTIGPRMDELISRL